MPSSGVRFEIVCGVMLTELWELEQVQWQPNVAQIRAQHH